MICENQTVCDWWQKYMECCRWEKGLTKGSLKWYDASWKVWGRYLSAPVTPQQVSAAIIAMRKSGRFTEVSINTYLRALRAFTRWTAEQKLQDLVPVHEIRCEKPVPKIFHADELRQLWHVKPGSIREERAILMSKLIGDCGLRASECLAIRMNDFFARPVGASRSQGQGP